MRRKLVKQAGKAYTVTLPISWIREKGLDAGDEIELLEQESRLILSTNQKTVGKKLEFSIQGFPVGMRYRYLTAAYTLGADEALIKVDLNKIPDMDELMGYTVIDQKDDIIHVQDIGGNSNEDLDLIFKRLFQILLRYFEKARDDITGKQEMSKERIRYFDGEINKLTFYLQRAVMKKTMTSSIEGKLLFAYSYVLEGIGDEILRMWRLTTESKIKVDKKLSDVFDIVFKGLELSFAMYYRFSEKVSKDLVKTKGNFRKIAYPIMERGQMPSRIIMHLNKIFDDAYGMNDLAMMREFNNR